MKSRPHIVIILVSMFAFTTRTSAQQCTAQGQYQVTTQQQLFDALDCIANQCAGCTTCSGNCPTEIIIPTGTTLDLNEGGINIGSNHSNINRPLTIRIDGTLRWADQGGDPDWTLFNVGGATHLTFTGTGAITSIHAPPSVTAIRTVGVTNVTVNGLSFSNLNNAFKQEAAHSSGVTLTNLTINDVLDYGIYIDSGPNNNYVTDITINNCDIDTAGLHGVRIWGNNVTVEDSEIYDVERTAVWVLEGSNVVIDNITSNRRIRLGPDFAASDSQFLRRLKCVEIRNIATTYSGPEGGVEILTGTQGCYMENITSGSELTVHLPPSGNNPTIRPTDRIHWKASTITPGVDVEVHSLLCAD